MKESKLLGPGELALHSSGISRQYRLVWGMRKWTPNTWLDLHQAKQKMNSVRKHYSTWAFTPFKHDGDLFNTRIHTEKILVGDKDNIMSSWRKWTQIKSILPVETHRSVVNYSRSGTRFLQEEHFFSSLLSVLLLLLLLLSDSPLNKNE